MKPKFSTGYFTPQSNRRKPLSNSKRSESTEFLGFGEVSEDVMKKLLSCPVKKQLIIELITSEKDKIAAYKKKLEKQNDLPMSSPLHKLLKKPFESPTALLRRRLEQRNASENRENSSGRESRPTSRQSMASTVPSPVSFEKILEGVIAFVEVRSGDRDRSEGVKAILSSMGATLRDKFTKDVTHVIFKDGSFTTYQKANLMRSKFVSVLWLEACKSSGVRVPEKDYPAIGAVGTNTYDHNQTILCSQMQKDYEEIIREEFNRSLASGEPLPSVKSLIDRRRTIMTPNFPKVKIFPNTPQDDSHDREVANIMRNTIQRSSHDLTPESPLDSESDTGAIIDGDLFDDFKRNQTLQKTSVVPEDMDLTELRGEAVLISSKENDCPNVSTNIYNVKTPKISKNKATAPLNHSESPNLFDSILYKRRTKLFEGCASPIINKESTTSMSENQLNDSSNKKVPPTNTGPATPTKITDEISPKNTVEPKIQASEKMVDESTSTAISPLQISNRSSSKKSFSPMEPDVINNIIEQLSDSPPTNNVTIRKKNIQSNTKKSRYSLRKTSPNSKEDLNDTSLHVKKLSISVENLSLKKLRNNNNKVLKQNVTVRKKWIADKNPTDDVDIESMFESDLPTKSNIHNNNLKKFNETDNLSNRRQTLGAFTTNKKDNSETNGLRKQTNNRRITIANKTKRIESNENCEENIGKTTNISTRQAINRRKTIADGLSSINGDKEEISSKIRLEISPGGQTKPRTRQKAKYDRKQIDELELEKSPNTEKNDKGTTPKKKLKLSVSQEKILPQNQTVSKTGTTDESTEGEPELDSPQENKRNFTLHNRRHTVGCAIKNKTSSADKSRHRKSVGVKDSNISESGSSEKNIRKFRKLYDPNDSIKKINSDNQERENKRRAKKPSDSGVFINPTIILSHKAKEYAEKNKLNVENSSSDESSSESDKKNAEIKKKQNSVKRTVNSDADNQVELKKWLLNTQKAQNKETGNDSRRALFKTPRKVTKNKNDEDEEVTPASTSRKQKLAKIPNTPKTPIIPIRNRRSTLEFQSSTISSSKKKLKIDKVKIPSIVCTKMHKTDVEVFGQIVKKLGKFNVEDEVSSKTTHLVAGQPKRTINMLRAITMGCWILKKEWLFRSLESGKWLPEEDFEETDFSPAVQKNRLYRQAFGPTYTMDIFQDCGLIYVSRGSTPRCSDLQELIRLCKGKVTKVARSATIIVGEFMKYEGITCVTEMWLLDSISSNRRLPFKKYLKSNRQSVIV